MKHNTIISIIAILFLINSESLFGQEPMVIQKNNNINNNRDARRPKDRILANETLLELLTPHFVRGQFAGGIGMVSLGFGRTYAGKALESAVVYGFTPKFDAPRAIHTISHQIVWQNRDQWRGQRYDWNFFVGVNTSFVISGGETFVTLPDRYPQNYYSPNAVRFYGFFGVRGTRWSDARRKINQKSVFLALNTHDQSIRYFINDPKTGYRNLFSLSFGITIYFPVKGVPVQYYSEQDEEYFN